VTSVTGSCCLCRTTGGGTAEGGRAPHPHNPHLASLGQRIPAAQCACSGGRVRTASSSNHPAALGRLLGPRSAGGRRPNSPAESTRCASAARSPLTVFGLRLLRLLRALNSHGAMHGVRGCAPEPRYEVLGAHAARLQEREARRGATSIPGEHAASASRASSTPHRLVHASRI
jgi:hypothetical protein